MSVWVFDRAKFDDLITAGIWAPAFYDDVLRLLQLLASHSEAFTNFQVKGGVRGGIYNSECFIEYFRGEISLEVFNKTWALFREVPLFAVPYNLAGAFHRAPHDLEDLVVFNEEERAALQWELRVQLDAIERALAKFSFPRALDQCAFTYYQPPAPVSVPIGGGNHAKVSVVLCCNVFAGPRAGQGDIVRAALAAPSPPENDLARISASKHYWKIEQFNPELFAAIKFSGTATSRAPYYAKRQAPFFPSSGAALPWGAIVLKYSNSKKSIFVPPVDFVYYAEPATAASATVTFSPLADPAEVQYPGWIRAQKIKKLAYKFKNPVVLEAEGISFIQARDVVLADAERERADPFDLFAELDFARLKRANKDDDFLKIVDIVRKKGHNHYARTVWGALALQDEVWIYSQKEKKPYDERPVLAFVAFQSLAEPDYDPTSVDSYKNKTVTAVYNVDSLKPSELEAALESIAAKKLNYLGYWIIVGALLSQSRTPRSGRKARLAGREFFADVDGENSKYPPRERDFIMKNMSTILR